MPVDEVLWSQQWIARAGTALAFLVKMFLIITSCTAQCAAFLGHSANEFIQSGKNGCIVWCTGRKSALRFWAVAPSSGSELSRSDHLVCLEPPLGLTEWAALLPIAAIVTPGTITVSSMQ